MFQSRTLLFALALCPFACGPLQAQPQAEQARVIAAGQAEQMARRNWRELQRATSKLELTDAVSAIAAYQKFYESDAALPTEVAVEVTSRIAQLWGRELKNPAKASEIYAWALEQWKQTPYEERLRAEAAAMAKLGGAAAGAAKAPSFDGGDVADAEPMGVEPMSIRPLTVEPMKALGGGVSKAPVGAAVRVQLQVMLGEIAAGRLSVQQAWKRDSLTVDDALQLLDGVNAQGNLVGGNQKTRRAVAMLVVERAPEKLESQQHLSQSARMWLGDALVDAHDARGVPLLESVLNQLKAQNSLRKHEDIVRAYVITERLAGYYGGLGQTERAIQTWLEIPKLFGGVSASQNERGLAAESLLMAARVYNSAGETEKARDLYAQVPPYGNGWVSAISLYEQTEPLMKKRMVKEAYEVMSQPLQATSNIKLGTVAQQAWLADFAYEQGDLEAALEHSRAALDASGDDAAHNDRFLRTFYELARDTQTRASGWKKQPIQTEYEEITFKIPPQESHETMPTRHFFVSTLRDVPLITTIDDARIQVHVTGDKQENGEFVEKEVVLEVPPSLNQSTNAVVTVSSPQLPGYQKRVLLHFKLPKE